ncbi:MAG: hypothetical protein PWQ82_16 [Thermosediminibacterales bacterium]|nr:hypothetical protein [Thermosediminibacterales bacterium]MDK2836373.1 hypothetical protein [Thermosediminibacterales bacterium]
MSAIPTGIWFMWSLIFGMSIAAIIIAVVLNKKEGGKIKW